MLDQDDRPIGRLLSRREIVALLGVSSAAWMIGKPVLGQTAASITECVVRPELMVEVRHRSDRETPRRCRFAQQVDQGDGVRTTGERHEHATARGHHPMPPNRAEDGLDQVHE